ncbi:unnamed protein product [Tuber aestivum]|uniref:Uncharacterized protein n=1 Tax=Tuber aestivum TaxID=59557 RepID=A0A292PNH9_9PEZI|nr:unnamed protein product [Tuber aestivum]
MTKHTVALNGSESAKPVTAAASRKASAMETTHVTVAIPMIKFAPTVSAEGREIRTPQEGKFPKILRTFLLCGFGKLMLARYIETLESRCIVLTQGLIELDRIRKGLPASSTQFVAGRPSGRMANSILKEIGIDASRIETDFDDFDGLCGSGSPGAESLGGGSNHSQYDEFYASTEHLSHPQSHHSPASSRSPSVNAASSRAAWPLEGHRRQTSHGYPIANSQFIAEGVTIPNLVSNGDYRPPILLMERPQYQPSSPAQGVFHYNQNYSLSSQDLPTDFTDYYEYQSQPSPTGSSTDAPPNYNL